MSYFVMPILVCACFPFAHARLFSLFDTRLSVVLMLASIFVLRLFGITDDRLYSCSSDAGASSFFLC